MSVDLASAPHASGLNAIRSAADTVMDAMNFLNEVMKRYPEAISFAPGAPSVESYEIDIPASIELYLDYVAERKNVSQEAARLTLYEYGPAQGVINDLISEALYNDGIAQFDPRHIVVTVGAQEGFLLCLRALFQSAGEVLAVTDPTYVGILGAAKVLGLNMVPVPDSGSGPDLDELEDTIRRLPPGKRLKAIYVAPDYSNPCGSRMAESSRRRLIALANAHDFWIIEDTAYAFTAPPDDRAISLSSLDVDCRVIRIGTFAKIALPGARVGYVATTAKLTPPGGKSEWLAERVAKIKSMVTVNTSPISQAIVAGMLLKYGVSITEMGRPHARFYQRKLRYLLYCLETHIGDRKVGENVTWNYPTGGFFIRVKLPVTTDNELLDYSARQFGVLWTPMAPFYLDGGGEHELRLSCSYLTDETIEEGSRRLSAFAASVA